MTDLSTRMPSCSDVIQRTIMQPAFSFDLLEQVLSRANLQAAWNHVRANKGAAGIDGLTIDAFPAWVKEGHWKLIAEQLETGSLIPACSSTQSFLLINLNAEAFKFQFRMNERSLEKFSTYQLLSIIFYRPSPH